MKKGGTKNVAASIHAQLLKKARDKGRLFNEILQYFAMERFLYRLSKSKYREKFVLKGALMMFAWKIPFGRSTMDIDLLGKMNNRLDSIIGAIKNICIIEVEPDGILFDLNSVTGEKIIENADYEGIRIRFLASLGNARIPMRIDIGFGDEVFPTINYIDYPTILNFPAPRLQGYSIESTISEKFEAMVKLGEINSRMKDFYDIWFLTHQFNFNGAILAQAIHKTFESRDTELQELPDALTLSFARNTTKKTQWKSFIRKNKLTNIPDIFEQIVMEISSFLSPVNEALLKGTSFKHTWNAPGPWKK